MKNILFNKLELLLIWIKNITYIETHKKQLQSYQFFFCILRHAHLLLDFPMRQINKIKQNPVAITQKSHNWQISAYFQLVSNALPLPSALINSTATNTSYFFQVFLGWQMIIKHRYLVRYYVSIHLYNVS